jgi:hypothetical protein
MAKYYTQHNSLAWPIIKVYFISPNNPRRKVLIDAFLDTGSVISCIPNNKVMQIGDNSLEYDMVMAQGITSAMPLKQYVLNVKLGTCIFTDHPIVAVPRTYAIIGRDIINKYKIVLDGPRLVWNVEGKP